MMSSEKDEDEDIEHQGPKTRDPQLTLEQRE